MDRLYIVMPAFNEEAAIRQVIDDWYPIVEEHHGDGASRLVVVNDGSTDRTQEILDTMQEDHPLLHVITKENGGHGEAIRTGYQCAVDNHADYIFQTDSDGQTNPAEFHAFWRRREAFDLIIGNRKHRVDGANRVMVARAERLAVMYMFHVNLADANAPFRLMKGSWLEKSLPRVPENFFLVNVLLAVIAAKQKRKILYLPISFRPRQGGTNSMNMKTIAKAGFRALRDFPRANRRLNRQLRKQQRP
ncbi:MAG: glycosyltransferase family 2 protein [Eubacterium sp.]|nr:glycosyltransferase family 2 protein [Eubacterium sp.]